MRLKPFKCLLLSFASCGLFAQPSPVHRDWKFSGYGEAYYCYDFANPWSHLRPNFFYSFNRHNEVNINIALARAHYRHGAISANIGFMTGTYAAYNLAAEQSFARYLYEANLGVRIDSAAHLWLEAGVFPSHIGCESAIGADCWNLTRSLQAENSPYYETGIKLSTGGSSERYYLALLFLNGWQQIYRTPGNNTPAFGTQLTIRPAKTMTFNWSTFAGSVISDSLRRLRIFNNIYAHVDFTSKLGVIAGFDIGVQQRAPGSPHYSQWYSPLLVFQYRPTKKYRVSLRAEQFWDAEHVIISTRANTVFNVAGFSLNFDYSVSESCLLRIEARNLQSQHAIFENHSGYEKQNTFVTTSIAFKL